jgi:hypothetical protein
MDAGVPRKELTPHKKVGISYTRRRKWMAKRAGRPKMTASKKRELIFRFVATKAEAEKIRAKAEKLGLTLSEYLRSVAIPKED